MIQCGFHVRPCSNPVTAVGCHYIARLRVVAVALVVEGLMARPRRSGTVDVAWVPKTIKGPLMRHSKIFHVNIPISQTSRSNECWDVNNTQQHVLWQYSTAVSIQYEYVVVDRVD